MKPTLKRSIDFRPEDFEEQALWVCAYGLDQDEAWYNEVDEITYRPQIGAWDEKQLVASQFIGRIALQFRDGTRATGFATPVMVAMQEELVLARAQPALFLPNGQQVDFYGVPRRIKLSKQALYQNLEKTANEIFPIKYSFEDNRISHIPNIKINGFATIFDNGRIVIEL